MGLAVGQGFMPPSSQGLIRHHIPSLGDTCTALAAGHAGGRIPPSQPPALPALQPRVAHFSSVHWEKQVDDAAVTDLPFWLCGAYCGK